MDYILLITCLLTGIAIGYLSGKVLSNKNKLSFSEQANELKIEIGTLTQANISLQKDLNDKKTEYTDLQEKYTLEFQKASKWREKHEVLFEKLNFQKEEIASLQEKFTKDFELIASKVLEEKSVKFTQQNKENIGEILSPLKERIIEFQKKVEDTNEKSAERSASLKAQLNQIRDLNREITQETKSLTQALRGDSKTQGNWGEMHLEVILNKAGLQKDIHFTKETNLKTEQGNNQRLDYIINLPDGKNLILDSKVSLTAYSKLFDTDNEAEKKILLQQHLNSVNEHIIKLCKKDYQNLHDINTPDYVLMFIANEPALTLALREDANLFEKALDKNIVLVSTSTLLATLRTISFIWKQDLQNKNAEEIANQAASLYDKFKNFTDDLMKLGNQLNTATGTYQDAMKKLSEGKDNLIRKTERLKELGVNPAKNIDPKLLDRSTPDTL